MRTGFFSLITVFFLISFVGQAQKKTPFIKSGGSMYDVPEAEPIADKQMKYKILYEISKGADKPDSVNSTLDKLARLVNLHLSAGIPRQNLDVVAVVHFLGTPLILSDEAYKKKYGVANPNTALINELTANGVKLYICGQSLYMRKMESEPRNPNIKVTPSAMLLMTTLQSKGYVPIIP
ncbi:DsrE family protein [Runella sp.]|uniref:DsrE family protein n=1 Tax=Runella sp. TaxID=1960881 RepID=UPI003D0E585A